MSDLLKEARQYRTDGAYRIVHKLADEIERLQKRNALLEDVAVAADDLEWGKGDPNLEKSAKARLRNALDKLREVSDG